MGVGTSAGEYFEDEFDYAKARWQATNDDISKTFETKLFGDEEEKFQEWKQKHAPNDSGYDYDFRGAYLGRNLDDDSPMGFDKDTQHWSDRWKKPNHPTFSNQSIYHDPSFSDTTGGKWDEHERFTDQFGKPERGLRGIDRDYKNVNDTNRFIEDTRDLNPKRFRLDKRMIIPGEPIPDEQGLGREIIQN